MDGVGALLERVRRQPGAGCPGCPVGLAPWVADELLRWEPRAEGGCPPGSGFSEAAPWAMDCSAPGFPACHQLSEIAQTHVHRVGDAIQPPHPLSSPSPPALNLSQHQGLFK